MKRFLLIISIIFISAGCVLAASPTPDYVVRGAITKYKKGNYSGCIQDLEEYVEKKPSALAYYYLGMAYTQAIRPAEALECYDKAIELAEKENNNYLKSYAQLGKKKTENSEMFAEQESYEDIDKMIKAKTSIPEEIQADLRKKHLEYLRNEMNSGVMDPHY